MKIVLGILSIITGLVLLVASFGSFYTVDQGERAVQLRYGQITGVADPGLHFKTPFVESVEFLSTRESTLKFTDLKAYSADQQPATLRVSVTWGVTSAGVADVYSNYGTVDNLQTRIIEPKAWDVVKNVFGKFTAANAITKRDELGQKVFDALKQDLSATEAVRLTGVQIESLTFSDAYEDSIEKRMKAEVQIATMEQTEKTEKINANIAVIQAKARADSRVAEAKAEADAVRLQGEAAADAIKAKGDALRANPGLVDLIAAERWDGTMPSTMIPGGALPFINVK
ncbi:prohibitin family protein [Castellaniella sp.]|uniref:prohibitin family protein n=1 Tax=Castellaniella sp. TaxID=1955812 RepID=UPI002AFF4AC9|nr:prohibitin family protein [Castellaniella sp.]